jgi:hypothetical protein
MPIEPMSSRRRCAALLCLLLTPAWLPARDTAFAKQEFAERRGRLADLVPDGLALVFGGEERDDNVRFRQAPDFYYLTGVEQPGTVLLVNGVTRRATLFAPRLPGAPPEAGLFDPDVQARYGIEVLPLKSFFGSLDRAAARPGVRRLYLPLTPPDDQLHARPARAGPALGVTIGRERACLWAGRQTGRRLWGVGTGHDGGRVDGARFRLHIGKSGCPAAVASERRVVDFGLLPTTTPCPPDRPTRRREAERNSMAEAS